MRYHTEEADRGFAIRVRITDTELRKLFIASKSGCASYTINLGPSGRNLVFDFGNEENSVCVEQEVL